MSLAEQDAIARNTPEAQIDRLGVAMVDLTAALQHNTNSNAAVVAELEVIGESLVRIEQKLAASGEARSSVELDSNNKAGELKAKVKRYEGSVPPVEETLADFGAAMREIAAQQANGWALTVAQVREDPPS